MSWDAPHPVPLIAIQQLHSMVGVIRENAWLPPPALPPAIADCNCVIATDSSEPSAAVCWQNLRDYPLSSSSPQHTVSWWQWPDKPLRHGMPTKEALAVLRGMELALEILPPAADPILWLVDCEPAYKAIIKGHSSASHLNAIVERIRACPRHIRFVWIPTHLMPADGPSRRPGFAPPHSVAGHLLSLPLLFFLRTIH